MKVLLCSTLALSVLAATARAADVPTSVDTSPVMAGFDRPTGPKLFESSSVLVRNEKGQPTIQFLNHRTVDYPSSGTSIGQGWDSLREISMPAVCIRFKAKEVGGQTAEVTVNRIFDSDTLRHEMAVSYSAAAKAEFGVGGGGASFKTNFLSSSEINTQFVNLLLRGDVQNGKEFVSADDTPHGVVELTDFALNLLKPKKGTIDPEAFLRYCGDSYVTSIERGASLYALYQFSSEKKTDKDERASSIDVNGSYLAFSGSASTSTHELKETISEKQVTGLKYLHTAHRGLRLPHDEPSVGESLASLGSALELKDAYPYTVELARYDTLPGWPASPLTSGDVTREVLMAFYFRLSDLALVMRDLERNHARYALDDSHDIANAARLPNLLEDRIGAVAVVLSKCEDLKSKVSGTESRKVVLNGCVTQWSDAAFSDYPYRALMPVAREQVEPRQTAAENKALSDQIATLTTSYNTDSRPLPLPIGGISLTYRCPQAPQSNECRALADKIATLQQALQLYLKTNVFLDIAESRYTYWIQKASRAREDEGLLNSALSPSELAMWRREIFCQYGVSPDAVPCPRKSFADMLAHGQPAKQSAKKAISLSSAPGDTPAKAWADLQAKLQTTIATVVSDAPYYYKLANENYTSTTASGLTTFSMTADAMVTYFAPADVSKLLSLP